MYSITGLTRIQIDRIITMAREYHNSVHPVSCPPSLGLRKGIVLTLAYLRKNRTQQELAATFHTSQPTVSRTISALTPVLAAITATWTTTVEELHPKTPYVIDGTLLPCWSWRSRPELYSGKHHTTGVTIQVACTLSGNLAWISPPSPGSTHDLTALRASGLLETLPPETLIADKAYIGAGMITPIRKPPGHDLTDDRKQFNTRINQLRYIIERTIAQLKTWRILHTDYRRPYETFHQTILAVIGLEYFKIYA